MSLAWSGSDSNEAGRLYASLPLPASPLSELPDFSLQALYLAVERIILTAALAQKEVLSSQALLSVGLVTGIAGEIVLGEKLSGV